MRLSRHWTQVLRAFQKLQNAAISGIIELAPAYTSVAVFFDPISVAKDTEEPDKVFDWLATRIRAAVAVDADRGSTAQLHNALYAWSKFPVCYDPDSRSTSMMLRDARLSRQVKSSGFTAALSIV